MHAWPAARLNTNSSTMAIGTALKNKTLLLRLWCCNIAGKQWFIHNPVIIIVDNLLKPPTLTRERPEIKKIIEAPYS